MGVFKRKDSPYWWLWLETVRRREATRIRIGDTVSQRKDNRALTVEIYQQRMRETARALYRLPVERPAIRFDTYAAIFDSTVIALHRGARREREMLIPLRKFFNDRLLTAIDTDQVRAYMAARGIGPRTINREVDLLKAMLRDAVPKYLEACWRQPKNGDCSRFVKTPKIRPSWCSALIR